MRLLTAQTWLGQVSCLANDWFIAGDLARGDTYEGGFVREVLAPFVKRARYVFDVGAHVGMHTLAYAHLLRNVPQARIFAFEPQSRLRAVLCKNLADNSLAGKVAVFPCALGHVNARTQMSASVSDGPNANQAIEYGSRRSFNLGGLSIEREASRCKCAPSTRSAFRLRFSQNRRRGIRALVLLGALDLLRKHRPIVVYEDIASKRITADMAEMFKLAEVPTCESIFSDLGGYRIHAFGCNYLAVPDGLEDLLPAAKHGQADT